MIKKFMFGDSKMTMQQNFKKGVYESVLVKTTFGFFFITYMKQLNI